MGTSSDKPGRGGEVVALERDSFRIEQALSWLAQEIGNGTIGGALVITIDHDGDFDFRVFGDMRPQDGVWACQKVSHYLVCDGDDGDDGDG